MKIIEPSFEIMSAVDGVEMLKSIEMAGRVCYKSEDRITPDSCKKFVQKILQSGHESVIEHEKITVKIICDRGVSHEIVRHRIASYSQESTRYCNYSKDKFGNELTMIRPCFWKDEPEKFAVWQETMQTIENNYNKLISMGATPEQARSVLPSSLKTEIVVTMNLREWRLFFRLRTSNRAHPQICEIAIPLLEKFRDMVPVVFDDISPSKPA